MTNEEIKVELAALPFTLPIDETGEWLNISVEHFQLKEFVQRLRYKEGLVFDFLFSLTCIDWKTHFTIVYHLTSTIHRHTVVIKVKLDRDDPKIETVSDIWRTAEFHEREVYDLFGVKFINHPDLRRLMLTDEWEGYPLRKDYEDPINMIKL